MALQSNFKIMFIVLSKMKMDFSSELWRKIPSSIPQELVGFQKNMRTRHYGITKVVLP